MLVQIFIIIQVLTYYYRVTKTYQQDWPAYDKAKTQEHILFKKFLNELLDIYFKAEVKKGKRFTNRERIFAMCIKIYNNSPLRKAKGILQETNNERTPSFRSLCGFFNDPNLSNLLDDLILISSLPVAMLETTAAIDATGFTTSRSSTWNNYKYGKSLGRGLKDCKSEGKERVWKKAHAVGCCRTNTIISVKVTEANVADSVVLEEIVGDRTKYFELKDFVADKAYSSRKILDFINELGLNPIIPFKKNVTGRSRGSYFVWRRMFKYFTEHQEEFYKRYHVRSNIETSFFMVKQKFGQNVWTRSLEANVNEIKVKFLCHNICVLIQEVFENNINLDFEACANKIDDVQMEIK